MELRPEWRQLKKAAAKAARNTPEAKAAKLRERIKRLETKRKRIETALKSARRSLAARERYLAKAGQVVAA